MSEATKASYLRASFLMSFLFLLSFFKSSALMASTPPCLARSISCWSPRMQMLMFGRGMVGSLTVPEKPACSGQSAVGVGIAVVCLSGRLDVRLSRWGS